MSKGSSKSLKAKERARHAAFERGVYRCPCCDVQLVWKSDRTVIPRNIATVDHIVPKSIGGTDSVDNFFVMCRKCNETRDTACFVQFLTSSGFSKMEAEELYKVAHVATVKAILRLLIDSCNSIEMRRLFKKRLRAVIRNYQSYFGDYLPEFELIGAYCR